MSQTIGEIQKNALEKILVTVGEYQGKQRIDIRTYYLPNQAEPDEWKPTKKGINLSPDNWHEFKELVEKVDQAIGRKSRDD